MALTKKLQELIDDGEITLGVLGCHSLTFTGLEESFSPKIARTLAPITAAHGWLGARGACRLAGLTPPIVTSMPQGKQLALKHIRFKLGRYPQHNHSLNTSDYGGTGIAWAAAQNPGQSSITTGDRAAAVRITTCSRPLLSTCGNEQPEGESMKIDKIDSPVYIGRLGRKGRAVH